MGIQTAYAREHQAAYEGQISDNQLKNVVTAKAEAAIPFGRVVVRGSNEDEVILPTIANVSAAEFIGITVRRQIDVAGAGDVLQYEAGQTVELISEGVITMIAEDAVAQDGIAFFRVNGGNEGQVRSDADGGDAIALSSVSAVAAAKFLDSAAAGAPVRVMFERLTS